MELPELPQKDFFSMGEACRIVGIPAHTLRYWEDEFGCLKPARRSGGHRRYTRDDLRTILSIKDLIRDRKMTVEGARRALSRQRRTGGAAPEGFAGQSDAAVKLLREIKKEINSLVEELAK